MASRVGDPGPGVGYARGGIGHNGGPRLAIEAEFPEKLAFFLEPRRKLPSGQYELRGRFKVAYGGRGGTKSWACARALVIRGLAGGLRALCTREFQSSMKESVHQLIKDQIYLLGLQPKSEGGSGHYRVLDNEIRGPAGTFFMFKGLQDPEALKSAEGVDICWVEEARGVPSGSWEKLIPTIRKAGSEIWVTFNPELEIDSTYQRFVKSPPASAIVQKVTWRDNPWLTDELRAEKDELKAKDFDAYLTVWEGFCRVALEGAVYARELRKVTQENRICRFAINPAKPVYTFFDLGRSDLTAIWFVQIVGLEYRIIHYYHNNGHHFSHYLEYMEELKERLGLHYGTMWLPHDADSELLASKRTIRQQAKDANYDAKIVPKIGVADGIECARQIFPNCWFHEDETADGIDCLRHYHYEVDEAGNRKKNPEHDWSSNGADGFRYMGVALRESSITKPKPKPKRAVTVRPGRTSWMR